MIKSLNNLINFLSSHIDKKEINEFLSICDKQSYRAGYLYLKKIQQESLPDNEELQKLMGDFWWECAN